VSECIYYNSYIQTLTNDNTRVYCHSVTTGDVKTTVMNISLGTGG